MLHSQHSHLLAFYISSRPQNPRDEKIMQPTQQLDSQLLFSASASTSSSSASESPFKPSSGDEALDLSSEMEEFLKILKDIVSFIDISFGVPEDLRLEPEQPDVIYIVVLFFQKMNTSLSIRLPSLDVRIPPV